MIGGDGVPPGVSCKQSAVHGAKHKRLHSPGVHHMVGTFLQPNTSLTHGRSIRLIDSGLG